MSYGLSARLLAEVLPLGRALDASTTRHHAHAVAQRLEDELGPGQVAFIEGCQDEWQRMPRPDLPLVVGLDGGFVHSAHQRSRRDGWFEVIAGKSVPADGDARCFGFVQTYDRKPKRRLYELLRARTSRWSSSPTGPTTCATSLSSWGRTKMRRKGAPASSGPTQ